MPTLDYPDDRDPRAQELDRLVAAGLSAEEAHLHFRAGMRPEHAEDRDGHAWQMEWHARPAEAGGGAIDLDALIALLKQRHAQRGAPAQPATTSLETRRSEPQPRRRAMPARWAQHRRRWAQWRGTA